MSRKEIYDYLLSIQDIYEVNDGSKEKLKTRCFLCGDSKNNPNKKRLGIKIGHDENEPLLYQCFNCNQKGIFDVSMLRQMNAYNPYIASEIRKSNYKSTHDDGTKTLSSQSVNRYVNNKTIHIEFPPIKKESKYLNKIAYLYKRIGYKIPLSDFTKLKLVFSIKDFLKFNNISPCGYYDIDILDRNYIGVLSHHNEFIILRDITNSLKMRYIKYNIFNVYSNANNFYTVSNQINILETEPIYIIIAEGYFDIFSILYNLYGGDTTNKILIASCNSSFTIPIQYFLNKGFVGENIFIECYEDTDTKYRFDKLYRLVKPYLCGKKNFQVYYNEKYKDFGVPKSDIQVEKIIL